MSGVVLGPWTFVMDASEEDLEARLPRRNSLRRAGREAKTAVAAAAGALEAAGLPISDRVGVYVGQQEGALDACARFIGETYRNGPRLASPLLFSESVANNAATHLSLTFGVTGAVQTFIGTRAAGIQALDAAREDLEGGVVDAALVVVLGVSMPVARDAYGAIYSPFARGRSPEGLRPTVGAVAFAARREGPGRRVRFAGVRCAGRGAKAVGALRALRAAAGSPSGRMAASVFELCRPTALETLREGLGNGVEIDPGPADLAESFALDPFLRLQRTGLDAVACLSEEGIAALLLLEA